MYVVPAEGRAPRCPYTNLRIPAVGQAYPDHDPHINLLLRFADVKLAEPPAEAAPPPRVEPPAPETQAVAAEVTDGHAAAAEPEPKAEVATPAPPVAAEPPQHDGAPAPTAAEAATDHAAAHPEEH